MNKSRLAIVLMTSALVLLGVRIGYRSWMLRKILKDTEQDIVDAGFKLDKLESPISPQIKAPVKIHTFEQFIEEANKVGADTIYYFRHVEGVSFYLGRKWTYLYSYDLKIEVEKDQKR